MRKLGAWEGNFLTFLVALRSEGWLASSLRVGEIRGIREGFLPGIAMGFKVLCYVV